MKQWEKPILNSLSSANTEQTCPSMFTTTYTGNYKCMACGKSFYVYEVTLLNCPYGCDGNIQPDCSGS